MQDRIDEHQAKKQLRSVMEITMERNCPRIRDKDCSEWYASLRYTGEHDHLHDGVPTLKLSKLERQNSLGSEQMGGLTQQSY